MNRVEKSPVSKQCVARFADVPLWWCWKKRSRRRVCCDRRGASASDFEEIVEVASLVLQERVQELIDVQSVDVPVRRDVSCPQIFEQLVSLWAPFQNSKWACCGPLVLVAMGPSGGLVAQLRMMVSRKWALFPGFPFGGYGSQPSLVRSVVPLTKVAVGSRFT